METFKDHCGTRYSPVLFSLAGRLRGHLWAHGTGALLFAPPTTVATVSTSVLTRLLHGSSYYIPPTSCSFARCSSSPLCWETVGHFSSKPRSSTVRHRHHPVAVSRALWARRVLGTGSIRTTVSSATGRPYSIRHVHLPGRPNALLGTCPVSGRGLSKTADPKRKQRNM